MELNNEKARSLIRAMAGHLEGEDYEYLENPEIQAHLASCPMCTEKAAVYAQAKEKWAEPARLAALNSRMMAAFARQRQELEQTSTSVEPWWNRLMAAIDGVQKEWQSAAFLLQQQVSATYATRSGGGRRHTTEDKFLPEPIFISQGIEGTIDENITLKVFAHVSQGDLKFEVKFDPSLVLPSAVVVGTSSWEEKKSVDPITHRVELIMPGGKIGDWGEIRIALERP